MFDQVSMPKPKRVETSSIKTRIHIPLADIDNDDKTMMMMLITMDMVQQLRIIESCNHDVQHMYDFTCSRNFFFSNYWEIMTKSSVKLKTNKIHTGELQSLFLLDCTPIHLAWDEAQSQMTKNGLKPYRHRSQVIEPTPSKKTDRPKFCKNIQR